MSILVIVVIKLSYLMSPTILLVWVNANSDWLVTDTGSKFHELELTILQFLDFGRSEDMF